MCCADVLFSDFTLLDLQSPSVDQSFCEKTGGKEDSKLSSGSTFTCLCQLNSGKPCSQRYLQHQLLDLRMTHLEMTRAELDLVILAHISSGLHGSSSTVCSKRKEQTSRQKDRVDYYHEGHKICRSTFMFIHAVFKDRLAALLKHYTENGVTPRQHGNIGKQPHNALSPEDCQAVVDFVTNYAEINAVLLPGRIPGYKRDDLKLLPSSVSKAAVFRLYEEACMTANRRHVAKRTFYHLWRSYCPYILPIKRRCDLCWRCQQNCTSIVRSINLCEADKSQALKQAQQHLNDASIERSVYTEAVAKCTPDMR